MAISLIFKRQGNCYLIFQSGTDRTDITGTKRTETDRAVGQKWHRSNRNAWHYNSEMGGTKRTEVSNMRVTGAISPTNYITTAFFRSQSNTSDNPFFEEKVKTIFSQPEVYKEYLGKIDTPINERIPQKRTFYTIGKSNKKKWFDNSEMLDIFLNTKDGQNHVEFYYPFNVCFQRFISKKIKGINALSNSQLELIEEYYKTNKRNG